MNTNNTIELFLRDSADYLGLSPATLLRVSGDTADLINERHCYSINRNHLNRNLNCGAFAHCIGGAI